MPASGNHQAFVRAIASAPADDLPRLVYADWLDERGDGERAEFIRLDTRLASLPLTDPDSEACADRWLELIDAVRREWLAELPRIAGVTWARPDGVPFDRGLPCYANVEPHSPAGALDAVLDAIPLTLLLSCRAGKCPPALATDPRLGGLRRFTLGSCDCEDEAITLLGSNPAVRRLTEVRARFWHGTERTAAAAEALASLPAFAPLESVELSGHDFGCRELSILAASPQFTCLRSFASVGVGLPCATMIEEAGVEALAASPAIRLERLRINRHEVGLAGVEILATAPAFAGLRELNLAGNSFGDRCAVALAASTTLSPECVVNVREGSSEPLTSRGVAVLKRRFRHVLHTGPEPGVSRGTPPSTW